jgi:tetratricopeptide (TPR) repeat protein
MKRRALATHLLAVVLGAGAPRVGGATEPRHAAEADAASGTVNATPAPSPAGAPDVVDAARVHFQRGVALYRSGAYDAAFAEFTRAQDLSPNYRILYNLAQVQAQRHDYVEALGYFQRYLAEGAGELAESRVREVTTEMTELAQRTSRLTVETNVDDAHLFVNELPAGDLPRDEPLSLNAGIHRLRVEKPGYVSASRVVTLVGGEAASVSLELLAELEMDELALPPLPLPELAPAPPPAPDRTALWTSLAATGALTGATVTFGLLTRRANEALGNRLERFPAPRASVESGRARVRNFALLADGFGLAAATALGVSTYFYFSTGKLSDDATSTTGLRAQIGPRASSVTWVADF